MLMQCPELFKGGTVVEEVVANIDIGPTVLEADGAEDARRTWTATASSRSPRARTSRGATTSSTSTTGRRTSRSRPPSSALRGDRYKYITYYGLWDTDELYDLRNDPDETTNLLYDPAHAAIATQMEDELYRMMGDLGGMTSR